MASPRVNSYITYPLTKSNARLRLFCFPYAGGSARVFQKWPGLFPGTIEVCPIQYPGRGNRLRDQPFKRITLLAADIAEALLPLFDTPYVLFGYSMGATVAFELVRHLRRANKILPAHLVVAACSSPHFPRQDSKVYELPEPEFIEELRRLNGTPDEVLGHPELMQLMLPMLRADFEAVQTYNYVAEPPLTCPLTVYGGMEDESVSRETLEGWRQHTTGPFSLQMIEGDHFFLHTSESALTRSLISKLVAL
jgi:surfactin synthase thioesterase subunit